MDMKRGFVTVVTGAERYYQMAVNLLNSYRFFAKEPLPFAIIAEEENEYTKQFDKTILLNNVTHTYMDKLEVFNNIPYKETIFLEPDILLYGDFNDIFEKFIGVEGCGLFGYRYPLDSSNGWFLLKEAGKYRDKVHFIPNFHSGIMYLTQSKTCENVYKIYRDVWANFPEYNIGGSRDALDDKCLAIALAVENCTLIPGSNSILAVPARRYLKKHPQCRMHKILRAKQKWGGVHWGNYFTRKAMYRREVHSLNCLINNQKKGWRFVLLSMEIPFSEFFIGVYILKNHVLEWLSKVKKSLFK